MFPETLPSPMTVQRSNFLSFDVREVRVAADYVRKELDPRSLIRCDPFRYCLEIFHRVLFKSIPIISPSLEIGIGDGVSSYFMHRQKPDIDYGADLPFGATLESCGMDVSIEVDHYKRMIGMDMVNIPFADDSFASIFSSHTMFYGQDLEATYSEILRVLAPGGTCTFCVDINEWHHYKPLMDWHRVGVPSAKFFPAEYHLELLEKCGARNISWRRFFQAPLETILVGMSGTMSGEAMKGVMGNQRTFDMLTELFVILMEQELAIPNGPDNGFNIFVTFQKPGTLPEQLTVPQPICLECRNKDLKREPTRLVCSPGCGATYSVRAGIPMMIRANHPGYSPTPIRQRADFLSEQTDLLVQSLLSDVGKGPLFVVYDGVSPVPGILAPSILLAALRYQEKAVSGVYDPSSLSGSGKVWRGIEIVHASKIKATPAAELVVFSRDRDAQAFIQKIRAVGISQPICCALWSEENGRLTGRLVKA
jgi:SAM-dependent methyltransferase